MSDMETFLYLESEESLEEGLGSGFLVNRDRTISGSNGDIPTFFQEESIFSGDSAFFQAGQNKRKKSRLVILHAPWQICRNFSSSLLYAWDSGLDIPTKYESNVEDIVIEGSCGHRSDQ